MTEQKLVVWRDAIFALVPRWLRTGSTGPGIIGKVLYAIAIQLDAVLDALKAGVLRRFPGQGGNYDSLPLLGAERQIPRGPIETDAGYAARLIPWLDAHKQRGGPYGMLLQLYAYWGGAFAIELVYRSGKRFSLSTTGVITRDVIPWLDQSTDGNGNVLWHWTLFFHWPGSITHSGAWGVIARKWGSGGIWGSTISRQDVDNIRLVPQAWNDAASRGTVVLLQAGQRKWGYPPRKWGSAGAGVKWGVGDKIVSVAIN